MCVWAGRREREIEGGSEGRGVRGLGGRGRENERAGGWRTASCRENFKQLVGRTLLRHLMVADSHDRQMREVKDALLGH